MYFAGDNDGDDSNDEITDFTPVNVTAGDNLFADGKSLYIRSCVLLTQVPVLSITCLYRIIFPHNQPITKDQM